LNAGRRTEAAAAGSDGVQAEEEEDPPSSVSSTARSGRASSDPGSSADDAVLSTPSLDADTMEISDDSNSEEDPVTRDADPLKASSADEAGMMDISDTSVDISDVDISVMDEADEAHEDPVMDEEEEDPVMDEAKEDPVMDEAKEDPVMDEDESLLGDGVSGDEAHEDPVMDEEEEDPVMDEAAPDRKEGAAPVMGETEAEKDPVVHLPLLQEQGIQCDDVSTDIWLHELVLKRCIAEVDGVTTYFEKVSGLSLPQLLAEEDVLYGKKEAIAAETGSDASGTTLKDRNLELERTLRGKILNITTAYVRSVTQLEGERNVRSIREESLLDILELEHEVEISNKEHLENLKAAIEVQITEDTALPEYDVVLAGCWRLVCNYIAARVQLLALHVSFSTRPTQVPPLRIPPHPIYEEEPPPSSRRSHPGGGPPLSSRRRWVLPGPPSGDPLGGRGRGDAEGRRALHEDKAYARMVAGAMQAPSISVVWGPQDGCGVSVADTQRMREDIYEQARLEIVASLPVPGDDGAGASHTSRVAVMRDMGRGTRELRDAFREGVEADLLSRGELGILPPIHDCELQILQILKRTGAIMPLWKKVCPFSFMLCVCPFSSLFELFQEPIHNPFLPSITNAREQVHSMCGAGDTDVRVICILRRHEKIRFIMASAVGAVMLANSQNRLTAHPTRFQMQKAAGHAAVQVQCLVRTLCCVDLGIMYQIIRNLDSSDYGYLYHVGYYP